MSAKVNPGGLMKPRPGRPAAVNPGGAMTSPAARQAPHPPHSGRPSVNPGGAMKPGPARPAAVNPGGRQIPVPAHKKHKKGKKHRGLALDGLPCCAAQALAASLAVAGGCVSAGDVEALYWLTADSADAGASILATLEAVARIWPGDLLARPLTCGDAIRDSHNCRSGDWPRMILGLDMPAGPHAVFDDGRSWWSWGERHDPADFPGAVIEEAWAVSWS